MVSLIVAVALHQGSISLDPRLTKPMSFDCSLVPLPDLLRNVSSVVGVTLSVDPTLEYLKVDAFLEDQPVGVTLEKLSEAFDLTWEYDSGNYKLTRSKRATDDLNNYIADEDKLVNQVVDKQLAVYRLINTLVPQSKKVWPYGVNRFEDWKPQRDAAKAELDAAIANGITDEKKYDLEVRLDALDKISGGLPNLELARIFGQLTPSEINDLRHGLPIIGGNSVEARLKYSQGDIQPNQAMPTMEGIKSVVFTKIDPGSKRIGSKELTFYENIFAVGTESASHYPFDEVAPALKKKPFAARLLEWDQSKNFTKTYFQNLDVNAESLNDRKSVWFENRSRLGDHLRWFHQMSNIPIIAPADRTIHPFIKLYRGVKTQGGYLKDLLSACHGYGRKSDDYLLVRNGVFWRKSQDEIPEQTFAMVEAKAGGKLTLKDISHFATNISRTQAMLVQDPIGFVVKFPRNKFGEAYPALQFLDSLSQSQIYEANTHGLNFKAFSQNQQNLFSYAVVEGLTDRGFVSEPLLNRFVASRFSVNDIPAMNFNIRNVSVSATYNAVTALDMGQEVELIPKRTFPNRPTVNFEFFYSPLMKITFSTEDF